MRVQGFPGLAFLFFNLFHFNFLLFFQYYKTNFTHLPYGTTGFRRSPVLG